MASSRFLRLGFLARLLGGLSSTLMLLLLFFVDVDGLGCAVLFFFGLGLMIMGCTERVLDTCR